MRARRRRRRCADCSVATGLLVLLAAACQPLPHPFADDRPPARLLAIHDSAGVAIAPLTGEPAAVARKLAAATAKALLKREIPASDKTTSLDSYQLYGRVVESLPNDGKATVTALWWLYDAKGHTVGRHVAKVEAATRDWQSGSDRPIERLAGLSADGLAPLIEDKAPAPAPAPALAPDAGHIRVAIDKIGGAPGDGATSLAAAIAGVLQRADLTIVAEGAKADFHVAGEVSVAPLGPGRQHVKILWRVRRADNGAEIGTVGQENDVPQGQLDGAWGEIAYGVALAAGDGLMQLVDRAAAAQSETVAGPVTGAR